VISDVLDEMQLVKAVAKGLLENVVQDEFINLITCSFTEALEAAVTTSNFSCQEDEMNADISSEEEQGILGFNSYARVMATRNVKFDESPFIQLTANPIYVDVLCVNCYECVRSADVDRHSLSCQKTQPEVTASEKCEAVNRKLEKLAGALRNRLIEIEENDEDEALSSLYSCIYAYALKVLENNEVITWHKKAYRTRTT